MNKLIKSSVIFVGTLSANAAIAIPDSVQLPDDALFYTQWTLEQANDADMDIATAWKMIDDAKANNMIFPAVVKLAVVDWGVDITRVDFRCVADGKITDPDFVDPICSAHGRATEDPRLGPGINMSAGWDFSYNNGEGSPDAHDAFSASHATGIASQLISVPNNQKLDAGKKMGNANVAGMVGNLPISLVPYGVLDAVDIATQMGVLKDKPRAEVPVWMIQAIRRAVRDGSRVINLSHAVLANVDVQELQGVLGRHIIEDILDLAYDAGVMVVVSAGNNCSPGLNLPMWPASLANLKDSDGMPRFPSLVSVASIDSLGHLAVPQSYLETYSDTSDRSNIAGCHSESYTSPIADYSPSYDPHTNFGSNANIAAGGVRITQILPGGNIPFINTAITGASPLNTGASFATPYVSGALAMAISVDASLRPAEGESWYCDRSNEQNNCDSEEWQARRLKAHAAVQKLRKSLFTGVKETWQLSEYVADPLVETPYQITEQCDSMPALSDENVIDVCRVYCPDDERGFRIDTDGDGIKETCDLTKMSSDVRTITLSVPTGPVRAHFLEPNYQLDPGEDVVRGFLNVAGLLDRLNIGLGIGGVQPSQIPKAAFSLLSDGPESPLAHYAVPATHNIDYGFDGSHDGTNDSERRVTLRIFKPYYDKTNPATRLYEVNFGEASYNNNETIKYYVVGDTSNVPMEIAEFKTMNFDDQGGFNITHQYAHTGKYEITVKLISFSDLEDYLTDISAPQKVELKAPAEVSLVRWNNYPTFSGIALCVTSRAVQQVWEGVWQERPGCASELADSWQSVDQLLDGYNPGSGSNIRACGSFVDRATQEELDFAIKGLNLKKFFNNWTGFMSLRDSDTGESVINYNFSGLWCGGSKSGNNHKLGVVNDAIIFTNAPLAVPVPQ